MFYCVNNYISFILFPQDPQNYQSKPVGFCSYIVRQPHWLLIGSTLATKVHQYSTIRSQQCLVFSVILNLEYINLVSSGRERGTFNEKLLAYKSELHLDGLHKPELEHPTPLPPQEFPEWHHLPERAEVANQFRTRTHPESQAVHQLHHQCNLRMAFDGGDGMEESQLHRTWSVADQADQTDTLIRRPRP